MKRFWTPDFRFFTVIQVAVGLVLLLPLLAGCGGNAGGEPAPPQIHYGEDVCEFCGMIVSDESFAAGFITADGQAHIFDDIGDMAQGYRQNSGSIAAIFVHDYYNHTWLKAESAWFVQSENLSTPMLSGVAAFAQQAQAETFAAEQHGKTLTFEALLAAYQ